jgi:hypothetical protein
MKRIIVAGCIVGILMVACNSNNSGSSNSKDSTNNVQPTDTMQNASPNAVDTTRKSPEDTMHH